MAKSVFYSMLLLGLCAQANKPTCFENKKELVIPTTKYTLTTRGEVLNANQKFANLPLPKGFSGECLITAPIKNDTLVILSMEAKDYDEKNAFVFRVSNKETKILWSQLIKKPTQPHLPFVNEKIVVIPSIGQATALNPETGSIRWAFNSKEAEGVDFKKFTQSGAILQVEGTKVSSGETVPTKFDLNIYDGKILPPKK